MLLHDVLPIERLGRTERFRYFRDIAGGSRLLSKRENYTMSHITVTDTRFAGTISSDLFCLKSLPRMLKERKP
jgi:hypothetical protein